MPSPLVLENPPRPRQMAAPRRRLEKRSSGNKIDFNDKREALGEMSPIPQIDGLEGEASDTSSGCTKTDIANLIKEMMNDMNNFHFGEKCDSNSLKNNVVMDEKEGINSVEDDNFEDVKLWALAQKRVT